MVVMFRHFSAVKMRIAFFVITAMVLAICHYGCTTDKNSDTGNPVDDGKNPDNHTNATGWLEVKENKIYLSDGSVFRGRGANIHDTRSCNACTWSEPDVDEVKRRLDKLVDDWGANFVRFVLESYEEQYNEWQVHWLPAG